ncbi:glutamyl-tRNA(Gln) amidotransferase subunit C, chloroplastic/mitochondrial [Trifolium repens]|nr:glutamyl-tRNA(Gln) amidotransferase subunit C, chloroplastic/mitochondrial [Trifolium repens]
MSSKVLYFRGTPLTTLWNPKIQQFRRLSSKTTNCCSLQPPNVSHLAKTAHISLTPTEVEEFGPKIQQVIGWFGQLQGVDLQSIEPSIRAGLKFIEFFNEECIRKKTLRLLKYEGVTEVNQG